MSKSIWRRPGTRHFQLVHRSLRDPLIHDPEASAHVLKSVDRSQSKSSAASPEEPTEETPESFEDAASYGIFFDDKEYDYMQHLRSIGSATDAFLVEAPRPNAKNDSKKSGISFKEPEPEYIPTNKLLPDEVLPTHPLDEISYKEVTEASAVSTGLRPDMDPKLREVLEALDDEAYAENDDGLQSDEEDAFWNDVLQGGEVDESETFQGPTQAPVPVAREGWEHLAAFNAAREGNGSDLGSDEEVDSDFGSEGNDTIGELVASSNRRVPRAPQTVMGSQFSMSSSAMFRNKGLQTLDEQFDEVEKMYADSDSEDADEPPEINDHVQTELSQVMDEFLDKYEVIGGKVKAILEGTPGVDESSSKLDRLRKELADIQLGQKPEDEAAAWEKEKQRIFAAVARQEREARNKRDLLPLPFEERAKEKWDCETILSTYSNVSNHPRMLRLKGSRPKSAQIKIDEKTGFPMVNGELQKGPTKPEVIQEQSEEESEYEEVLVRETVSRSKGESPEEKKARKTAFKAEKASRRAEKKSTKTAFEAETNRQKKIANKAVANGKAADAHNVPGIKRLA